MYNPQRSEFQSYTPKCKWKNTPQADRMFPKSSSAGVFGLHTMPGQAPDEVADGFLQESPRRLGLLDHVMQHGVGGHGEA